VQGAGRFRHSGRGLRLAAGNVEDTAPKVRSTIDSPLEESGSELTVPLWLESTGKRFGARSRRIVQRHNNPERFRSDPQTREVVMGVAQPARRAGGEYLQQRVFGVGRDL
jgi:hypothetical protein